MVHKLPGVVRTAQQVSAINATELVVDAARPATYSVIYDVKATMLNIPKKNSSWERFEPLATSADKPKARQLGQLVELSQCAARICCAFE